MTRKDIVVVIPVYKKVLTPAEALSLRQCSQVLEAYRQVLVLPVGLSEKPYLEINPKLEIRRFAAEYFQSIAGYNKLMMSVAFYRRFRDFKYMLIYQLDAYVFKDELLEWCKKGYDYIGAPWLVAPEITKKRVIINFSKRMVNHVGNGGFSLRLISKHTKLCQLFWPLFKLFPKNEDLFWGYLIEKIYPFYKKPSVEEALSFAFEAEPHMAFERNQNQLPFGCHAWEKHQPEFWSRHIETNN